jgi:hypothetical protein
MRKKMLPAAIAVVVSLMFLVPGFAFGGGKGGGKGTPSPPPSNPPCDADGHNGQPPPYGGPNINSLMCKLGHLTTGNATGNACPPDSQNPDGTPPDCGHGTTGNPTTGNPTTGNPTTGNPTTGGGGDVCTWAINLGNGALVIPGTSIDGAIGLHADVPADISTHPNPTPPVGLVHACVGLGSAVTPVAGAACPTGTVPIEAQPDDTSGLLLCVLL